MNFIFFKSNTTKKILKFFIFIFALPLLFFIFDLTDIDNSYVNRSVINIDIKNQNSRHTMKFTAYARYYYLKIYKILKPENYEKRWGIESVEKRNKIKKIIEVNEFNRTTSNAKYSTKEYSTNSNWFKSHGNYFSTRFSNLNKINLTNVHKLKLAWIYEAPKISSWYTSNIQANPVVYKNLIISPNPENQIVALNGETGKMIWQYQVLGGGIAAKRGLTIFDPKKIDKDKYKDSDPWIFFSNNRHKIFALNVKTGFPIKTFGNKGIIKTGLTPMPPVIYKKDLIIINTESVIEVYDVETGKLKWKYKAKKTLNSLLFKNFPKGSPWGGISLDIKRGYIFFNTGNPEDYHVGTDRPGPNLYANSVVAFDLNKKDIVWYFQEIPHDLWNMDLAAPPILTTIKKNNILIDVVVSISKTGNVLILDRDSGKSLFPYIKKRAPTSDVPGEKTSSYQIEFPKNDRVCRNRFKKEYLTNLPYVDQKKLENKIKNFSYGIPEPPKISQKMIQLEGCVRWAGGSVDSKKNILYVSTDQDPFFISIEKSKWWRGFYTHKWERFLDEKKFPAIKPPWGSIVAYNLNNGRIIWKMPFGEWEELKKLNVPKTGTKNRAGITASSGDLIFASGTFDNKFIVINSNNGETLWEYQMTHPSSAAPTIYEINNKQYIVVPAFESAGDKIYAFTLSN